MEVNVEEQVLTQRTGVDRRSFNPLGSRKFTRGTIILSFLLIDNQGIGQYGSNSSITNKF